MSVRQGLGIFVLLLGGVSLGVLSAELGLRIAGKGSPSYGVTDDVRGWAGRPGARVWKRGEGNALVEINSDGFRDRERSRSKPVGTFRIVVLGDSFTEAAQVEVGRSFAAILESRLADCSGLQGCRVEVLNMGASGYGTAQELLTLREKGWAYQPDAVLLALLTNNDIKNNSRELQGDPSMPYFVLEGGELVLDDSFRESAEFRRKRLAYALLDRSYLAQLIKGVIIGRRGRVAVDSRIETALANETDPLLYGEPDDPRWAQAWAVTEALLARLRDEASAHGSSFLISTLSNALQVHPDPTLRSRVAGRLRIRDLWYPDHRIRAFAQREGIPILCLGESFAAEATRSGRFFHGFQNTLLGAGHWNEDGHSLAAELISEWLCRELSAEAGGGCRTEPAR